MQLYLVLLCQIVAGYFTPSEVVLSSETTLITQPVAEDGLPDYRVVYLDRLRGDATPLTNGAVQYWLALGPDSIARDERAAVFAEIGCPPPSGIDAFEDPHSERCERRLREWLCERWGCGLENLHMEKTALRVMDQSLWKRWDEDRVAPLADWLLDNEVQLDLLVVAAQKPAFYSPPSNLLLEPSTPLFDVYLYDVQIVRDVARGLVTRAMRSVSSEEYDPAWRDLRAALCYAEKWERRDELVSSLIAMMARSVTYRATLSLIDACDDPTRVQGVLDTLQRLGEPVAMQRTLAFGEPLTQLDAALHEITDRGVKFGYGWGSVRRCSIDPTISLRCLRTWQQSLFAVAKIEDRVERRAEVEAFSRRLDELSAERVSASHRVAFVLSRHARSVSVGKGLVGHCVTPLLKVFDAEDRTVAEHHLTVLAATLKLYKIRHGDYPDSLDDLTPDFLVSVPIDPYTNRPFRYERRGDGFVAYSLGPNAIDDGGHDYTGDLVDGDWADFHERPDYQEADIVVRLPVPALTIPDAPLSVD